MGGNKKRFPKKDAVSFVVGTRSMREYEKDSIDEKVLIPTTGNHNNDKNSGLMKDLKDVLPSKEAPNLLGDWRAQEIHIPDDVNEALESSDDENSKKKKPKKFEELDDDFVSKAQSDVRVPNFEDSDFDETDSEAGEYDYDLNDIDDGPVFFNSEGKKIADPAQENTLLKYVTRIKDDKNLNEQTKEYKTFLEEKFDLTLRKKEKEEESEESEDVVLPEGGGVEIKEFDAILDEFLEDQRQHVNKGKWAELGIEPKEGEENYVDMFRVKKASLKKDPFFSNPDYRSKSEIKDIVKRDLVHQIEEDSYEEISESESEEWDVETVLSTYTNTENHPALINEPQKEKKIQLSKTGIPLGILPTKSKKKADPIELQNIGKGRPKDETSLEKKLRKKQIKEEKKKQREIKKKFKNGFTEEQKIQRKIQITNPPISRIRIN